MDENNNVSNGEKTAGEHYGSEDASHRKIAETGDSDADARKYGGPED